MRAGVFIPLIDLVFLSLGAIVAILSQSRIVESFAVEITEVGEGIAVISRDEVTVVTLTPDGVFVDGSPVEMDNLPDAIDGPLALLRSDRAVPADVLIKVVGVLAAHDVEMRIEVEERP